ncbi:hypothetical protein [Lichenifustis flavocetrariae]|uniref:Uncharacterized protein n=1 Tax=Lichenifustis flavocetrariae TaxID=2949735 RepID=A0AA41YUV5_9HYPH|nr:hypothetical protein [Lichenifustis flavocetrariae]MCW6508559.1 hypothetical protein [Lichenifustis flavocetrariae]
MIATYLEAAHSLSSRGRHPSRSGDWRPEDLFDSSGVDHLWLSGWNVDWETGRANKAKPGGTDAHTHCSAFVAALAMRVGVYILRPPEHGQQLLANAQADWLRDLGHAFGWRALAGEREAQASADEGRLTVASYKNPNPKQSGHIAFVRPSNGAGWQTLTGGPTITQAGGHNFIEGSLQQGFGSRRSLVRFYACRMF